MSNFWSDKLGVQPPPPGAQPATTQPAWWAPPAPAQQQQLPPGYGPPGQYQQPSQYTYEQLKAMRVDEMDQAMMEQLAEYELQADKYQQNCPHCGAGGFIKQGDRVGGVRFGTDRCFECGAGSSTLTGSPEPATGVTGNKANSQHTRQTANGGLQSGYGHHHSALPASYLPTRG